MNNDYDRAGTRADRSMTMTEKPERIDHATEVRRLLEAVEPFKDQHLEVAMASAQTHATLALVEQQKRIADWLEAWPLNYQEHPIVEIRNGGES